MKLNGERYEIKVPDTLDLAERARIGINGLTGTADVAHNCEGYHCANATVHPAYMNHVGDQDCEPKVLEAMALMRVASGSEQNLETERCMLDRLLHDIEGGLWWMKPEGRPWTSRHLQEDTADVMGQSRLMLALMAHYEADGDSKWLETVQKMADALGRMVLPEDDYAYYPTQRYYRDGWRNPQEGDPKSPSFYAYPHGNALRALSRWYGLSGDEKTLKLINKLIEPLLWPQHWQPLSEPWMVEGADHAHWQGHSHSTSAFVWGMLEYAIATNNAKVKRFVRDWYEYSRNFGLSRIGFFPAVVGERMALVNPEAWEERGARSPYAIMMEGCCLGELICIAIGLCNAEVGDYWDDVDQYVRNHMAEMQLLRRDLLEEISQAGSAFQITPGDMTDDNVIERMIGTFVTPAEPTAIYPFWTMCCVGNLGVGLGRAWEAILRHQDGTAQVNLLLNRASPWLDLDSYIPYEGKIILRNKTARRIHLRLPMWVHKKSVLCRVQRKNPPLMWLGNYLIIDNLAAGDVVTVEFPMVETIEHYTEPTYGIRYTMQMKGNTLVDISPRADTPTFTAALQDDGLRTPLTRIYPIYQREHYKGKQAPMVKRTRFVSV